MTKAGGPASGFRHSSFPRPRRVVEYLYKDGDSYVFMDTETYDQPAVAADVLGSDALYLVPNMQMQAMYHEGRMVSYELPKTVEHAVTDTPPGIKGATATNQMKDAGTETGLVVKVPPFINPGDRIRINTENGAYLERVSK